VRALALPFPNAVALGIARVIAQQHAGHATNQKRFLKNLETRGQKSTAEGE
jgi:hypothetical protein